GMELHYLTRTAYRKKEAPEILNELRASCGDSYLIPEGDPNALASKGTKEISAEEDSTYDYTCTSLDTGGTMAGLVATAKTTQSVMGFSSLKGNFMSQEVQLLLEKFNLHPICRFQIINDYRFGGYGKHKPELVDFILDFKRKTGI